MGEAQERAIPGSSPLLRILPSILFHAQVTELKKAQQASKVIMDELENDASQLKRELEEVKGLARRQEQRIVALEKGEADASAELSSRSEGWGWS